jgi:hypothetical protein
MIRFGLYRGLASPSVREEIVRAVAEAIRDAEVMEPEAAGVEPRLEPAYLT